MAENHPSRLASQHAPTSTYQANRQVDEAVTLLKHIIKVQKKLAEDHSSRLALQHMFATIYQTNRQVDEELGINNRSSEGM